MSNSWKNLMHVVHEVEDGDIGPEEGLEEIKELVKAFEVAEAEHEEEEEGEDHGDEGKEEEGEDHGDEGEEEEGEDHGDEEEDHGDEELSAMVFALIDQVEDGQMDAGDAIEAIEGMTEEGEDEHAGHGHGLEDPHFWFDPPRVKIAVDEIAAQLSALDPDRTDVFGTNASAYKAQLDELHSWTESQVEAVPEDRRLLVTSHDSLGYFANLYGFEVVGGNSVIHHRGGAVGGEPGGVGRNCERVRSSSGFRRDDGERTSGDKPCDGVRRDAGTALLRFSRDRKAAAQRTYIEMARTKVSRITEALK